MFVVIETPKWSFTKIAQIGGVFKRDFLSPIPTPFNYGYIEGTVGDDGSPFDIIVLGERLDVGSRLDVEVIGKVHFLDDDIVDDKYIASLDDKSHQLGIMVFFRFYAFTKLLRYLFSLKRWSNNRFQGIIWFGEGVKEVEKLKHN